MVLPKISPCGEPPAGWCPAHDPARNFVKTVMVRVVHVTPQLGSFLVGGTLNTPLAYTELTALVIDASGLSETARVALREHYGERLVLADGR